MAYFSLLGRTTFLLCSQTRRAMSQAKSKVLITRQLPQDFITPLLQDGSLELIQGDTEAMSEQKLCNLARGVSAIFCMLSDRIDQSILDSAGEFNIHHHVLITSTSSEIIVFPV